DAYRATDERAFHLAYDLQCGRTPHLQYRRCSPRRNRHLGKRQTRRDPLRQILFNVQKVADHRLAYVHMSDLGKLEDQRRRDMRLLIRNTTRRLRHLHMPVALVIGKRALWRVDRDLVKISRSQARKLRVEIREQTAL